MEQISCEICYAPYNTRGKRPVLLSCNRTICLECQIALSNSECPFCKEIIALEEIKINIEVLLMVKEREQMDSKPYIPPYVPPTKDISSRSSTKDAEFSTNTPKEELRHPEMTQDVQPLLHSQDIVTCPNHQDEFLEWYKSLKEQNCQVCRSNKVPVLGHWRCKHLDYFVCETCKPPQSSCPGHPNIQLKWINQDNPNSYYCKICKNNKRARELVVCKRYGCVVCKSCHTTYFKGYRTSEIVHINKFKECVGDCFLFLPLCIPLFGWICLCWFLDGEECPHCLNGACARLDCKCSCLMRGNCGCYTNERKICHRCLNNNCSFHTSQPVKSMKYSLCCSKCQSTKPISAGGWVCPHGDLELCNKCFFYPGSPCPQHPRKLMILASNSDIREGCLCSICSVPDAKWKCKDCPFFVCEKCAIRPLYCPNHTTSDLTITKSNRVIICSMCYTENTGVDCYSCPKSDYFLCSKCYQDVLNIYYLYIYIYIILFRSAWLLMIRN